jgi:hypothetical protein
LEGLRLERIADLELLNMSSKELDKLIMDAGLNKDAGSSTTALPMVKAVKSQRTE